MDLLPLDLAEVLSRLSRELKALYGDRYGGLLLYGSYARGEAHEDSDVDLLLLLKGPVDPVQEILRLESAKWPISLESGYVLSILPNQHRRLPEGRGSVSLECSQRGDTRCVRSVQNLLLKAERRPSTLGGRRCRFCRF